MNINEEVKKLNARIDALESRLVKAEAVLTLTTSIVSSPENPIPPENEQVSKSGRTKTK